MVMDEKFKLVCHVEAITGSSPSNSSAQMELDLSHYGINEIPTHYLHATSSYSPSSIKSITLHHNLFKFLPDSIALFSSLVAIDISNNHLLEFPDAITSLRHLRVLVAKNNNLDTLAFPKKFNELKLEMLNLSGNQLSEVPDVLLNIHSLRVLHLGGNHIERLPCKIGDMITLEFLYMGGNRLRDIPATIGKLRNLASLILCENKLETIPSTIANLQRLQSLSLHKNMLTTLPTEIVTLQNLQELSLRGNPLVVQFARDVTFDPPSLKELAGRMVRLRQLPCAPGDLPAELLRYLASAHQCVNPKCKGVYFEARVEHVKFVDFCGKFRVPLLQYLCSPRCSTAPAYAVTDTSDSEYEDVVPSSKLQKVLLG